MKRFLTALIVTLLCISCVFANEKKRPSVALVLSGGGAKGIAHIAVIQKLEELGIPIDKVYGTSMGALIGGIYSAGYSPNDLAHLVLDNNLAPMFTTLETSGYHELSEPWQFGRTNTFSLSVSKGEYAGISGLIDDYQIMNFFESAVGNVPKNVDFEKDLVIPFNCNAANMLDGSEYVFKSGNLLTAMRSSMAIPLVFAPVVLEDGTVLMDGGVVCNRTVHLAQEEGYDIIICVSFVKNPNDPLEADSYRSLSGVAGGTLSIILDNVSRGEAENATYHFPIDVTGFGVLSFEQGADILQRGYDQVALQMDKMNELASLFTEDQKEYKDPNRKGEYFSKYTNVTTGKKVKWESSAASKTESAYQKSRVGFGLLGGAGLEIRLDDNDNKDSGQAMHGNVLVMANPKFSLNAFFKDINGSNVSAEAQLTFAIPTEAFAKGTVLFKLNPNKQERIYAFLESKGVVGSITSTVDSFSSFRFNGTEFKLENKLGFKVTNEYNHNIVLSASADMLWPLSSINEMYNTSKIHPFYFYPKAEAGFVLFSKQSGSIFSNDDSRLDVMARFGLIDGHKTYKFGLSAEKDFDLSEKSTGWVDFTAHTSREPWAFRDSYESYGGWDGMPGYLQNESYRDILIVGTGYQRLIHQGIANIYLMAQARASFRSYYSFNNPPDTFIVRYAETDMSPFAECFSSDREWDVGGAIGIGIDMPTGSDIVFGIGLNSKLRGCIYLELK